MLIQIPISVITHYYYCYSGILSDYQLILWIYLLHNDIYTAIEVIFGCFNNYCLHSQYNSTIITAMTVINNINEIVYLHRKSAGLSRNDLAILANVGKTAIYDLEKGKQTMKWSTILAILNALNISLSFDSPLMKSHEKSSH